MVIYSLLVKEQTPEICLAAVQNKFFLNKIYNAEIRQHVERQLAYVNVKSARFA